ncbi:uncharacterized protein NPIL_51581 [Nephila pilipes]|uniref:Uncharacterized protein n=1 Tax=Nephila pilipes TaxID=299642 RepID=A0A8X6Q168_NEPPI|nr:uncharacterized protein NPIL_51581 [Nephila pilipes]
MEAKTSEQKISCPNLDSTIRPVSHRSEISVSQPPSNLDDILSESEDEDTLPPQDESSSDFSVDEKPQLFSQDDLNDLIRDIGFSRDAAKLLILRGEPIVTWGVILMRHRHRMKEFT